MILERWICGEFSRMFVGVGYRLLRISSLMYTEVGSGQTKSYLLSMMMILWQVSLNRDTRKEGFDIKLLVAEFRAVLG